MLPNTLTAELSRTPVADLATILSRTPVADLTASLARYVKECCALDPAAAAAAIATAVYGVLPADDEDADLPCILKFTDFMNEIGEPPLALVPDFLPAKKLICLSGAAKQGKSLVGLELLHAVSAGRKLMGRFPVDKPGPVAYFGLEDGGDEIKSRFIQRGITDLLGNLYVVWQSFDMATPAGFETFKRLISEMSEPPSLIIIDTAREAFKLRDWNDASLVSAAISPIRKWAHKNCTVILITHNNKDKFATGVNKISGSGALVSSCDSFMILENQVVLDNNDLRWDWEMAGRGMKSTKYVLQMDTNNLHVRILGHDEIEASKQEDREIDRNAFYAQVETCMRNGSEQGVTIKMIADALSVKIPFASTLVQEMLPTGRACKMGNSQSTQAGRPAPLYALGNGSPGDGR